MNRDLAFWKGRKAQLESALEKLHDESLRAFFERAVEYVSHKIEEIERKVLVSK